MCSIGGFISEKPLHPHLAHRLSRALIWYGADRGQQSSGVYANGKVYKRAVSPSEFVASDEFEKFFDAEVSLCLTHTRAPTCGGRGDDQAQPFQHGDVVTVHNGVYHQPEKIAKKFKIKKKSGVDSELITSYLAEYGIANFNTFLDEVWGCSAIAAVIGDNLYLVRHNNPISYDEIKFNDNTVLVFASTNQQLSAALSHVWLLSSYNRGRSLREDQVFHVTTSAMTPIGGPLKGFSQSYGGGYSGNKSLADYRSRWNPPSSAPTLLPPISPEDVDESSKSDAPTAPKAEKESAQKASGAKKWGSDLAAIGFQCRKGLWYPPVSAAS